jgi:hypothetical protein
MPRLWWTGFVIGLVLLAAGGALGAVRNGMDDNLATDGCGSPYGPAPSGKAPEDVDCDKARLARGIVHGAALATQGPGIAIAILAGVYVLGAAIVGGFARRGSDEKGEQT